ncbi:MAG: hypothetical protein ACREA2_19320 [Blastocatellia bacterium]
MPYKNDHQFIALRLVNQVNETLREHIIACHAVTLALQEGAGVGAVRIGPPRIAFYVPRVGVRDEFKPADVGCLVRLVAVGVSVARQIALELQPVHSLDAPRFVRVNKEMLLGVGDIVKFAQEIRMEVDLRSRSLRNLFDHMRRSAIKLCAAAMNNAP